MVGRERELERLRSELARLHAESEGKLAALAALAEELAAVRAAARGQATRIRLRALRDAAELSGRITELTQRPAESRERLLDGLQEAIARIGAADDLATLAEEADRHDGAGPAEPGEQAEGRPGQAEMFAGMVEVEVGPLADFSQLVGFEDAAGAIGATSEISVTRFAQGRATLEMKLAEPVELLRELEQRMPFEFRVRDQRADRLVLDVETAA